MSINSSNNVVNENDVIEMIIAGVGGYGDVSMRDKSIHEKELKEGIIDEKWLSEAK